MFCICVSFAAYIYIVIFVVTTLKKLTFSLTRREEESNFKKVTTSITLQEENTQSFVFHDEYK